MKKLIISSDSLKKGLRLLANAISSKPALPVTGNVYMKVTKGELEMVATDMELTISAKFPAETGGDPFELLIPFDFLKEVVSLIRSAPVVIEHPSARKASIIEGDNVFRLDSLDKLDDFPKLPSVPKKNSVILNGEFLPLLHKAMLTVGKDESKPALMKACLDVGTTETNLVSTDTGSLFMHKIPVTTQEPDQLLFTTKLEKALHGLSGDIEFSWTQKQMAFSSNGSTVLCTRQEDKYPNYKSVLGGRSDANLVLERPLFTEALQKVCLTSLQLKETTIFLTKDSGKIHLETDDPNLSRKISVTIPGGFLGETEKVTINAGKLLTIMEQVETPNIRMQIDAPNKPILVSAEENPDYLGLIMPLKINE